MFNHHDTPTMTDQIQNDRYFMAKALEQGQLAFDAGEVPVGAVVVLDGKVIGRGFNQPITSLDPSAHAEIVAIRDAAKNVGNYRLSGATLYVTVEPCAMCSGCIVHSRIERLVYGTTEPKAGVVESAMTLLEKSFLNHKVETCSGVMSDEAADLMSSFFKMRREGKKKLKELKRKAK
jgi:tRNA(adenine34) deaminase